MEKQSEIFIVEVADTNEKDTRRHDYHLMVQFLKAILLHIILFLGIILISFLAWGLFIAITLYFTTPESLYTVF